MKKAILFFILPFNFCFSQLDTALIFREIDQLNNDSLLYDYWQKLHDSDQNLEARSPQLQAENSVKGTYAVKKYGYPSKFGSVIAFTPALLWIHNFSFDMNIYTFPVIVLGKESQPVKPSYPNYFIQNMVYWFDGLNIDFPDLYHKTLQQIEQKKMTELNVNELVSITNEYLNFLKEENPELIGSYYYSSYGEKIPVSILKSKEGRFWLKTSFSSQMIRKSGKIYLFESDINQSYLEEDEQQNLILKDENANIIIVFKKKS